MLICMLAPYSSLIAEGLWKVNWNFLGQRLEPIHKALLPELKDVFCSICFHGFSEDPWRVPVKVSRDTSKPEPQIVSSAAFRSSIRLSTGSMPTESRTRLSLIPALARFSGLSAA